MSEFLDKAQWRGRQLLKDIRSEWSYRFGRELSDFELLQETDPFLARVFGELGFRRLKDAVGNSSHHVADIGAGSSPLRGAIFLDATHTFCIDPAYSWYEHRPKNIFDARPYNSEVFGGYGEKEDFVKNLKRAYKNLQLPERIEGMGQHLITGKRRGSERSFIVYPGTLARWLPDQEANSVPNLVLWRVFPALSEWGRLIESLAEGGILITTGVGKTRNNAPLRGVSCGVDINNSAIPLNRRTEDIGLESLTDLSEVYFYRKTRHLSAEEITGRIKVNQ